MLRLGTLSLWVQDEHHADDQRPTAGADSNLRGVLTHLNLVITFTGRGILVHRLEHLTCFVAGNLALGVHTGAVNGTRAAKYMALARNLTNTCYEMYRRMPTGARQPNPPHSCTSMSGTVAFGNPPCMSL